MFRITVDTDPPIPETVSPLLDDFLRKCFQRDPIRRPDAKTLSDHEWLKNSWTHKVCFPARRERMCCVDDFWSRNCDHRIVSLSFVALVRNTTRGKLDIPSFQTILRNPRLESTKRRQVSLPESLLVSNPPLPPLPIQQVKIKATLRSKSTRLSRQHSPNVGHTLCLQGCTFVR